jgi:hypothetical protein
MFGAKGELGLGRIHYRWWITSLLLALRAQYVIRSSLSISMHKECVYGAVACPSLGTLEQYVCSILCDTTASCLIHLLRSLYGVFLVG